MNKFLNFISNFLLPGIIIGSVVVVCICFLLNNLPYDDSSIDIDTSKGKIVVSTKYLMNDLLGKNISIDNQINGTTGYSEIEVNSNVDGKLKYEIVLVKESCDLEIDSKFIKVYLTDFNDIPFSDYDKSNIPTYYDLRVSEKNPGGRVLYSGYLKNKGSQKFKLRMWVSDTHAIFVDERMFSVKLKVNVR